MRERDQKKSDRTITIWLMEDLTAEPRQYQLQVRWIKAAVAMAVVVPTLLLGFLLGLSLWSVRVYRENESRAAMAGRYLCSDQKLDKLAVQLAAMEQKTATTYLHTRQVVEKMEQDLQDWLPEGAVGGGEDGEKGRSASAHGLKPGQLLTPGQLEKVTDLERRLSRLNLQLELYERTLHQVEGSWHDRNYLFSTLPTMWPLTDGRITSRFGLRIHPITRKVQMHQGLDIYAPYGTVIHAAASGTVVRAGMASGYGNFIEIDHGYGISSAYGHSSALLVKPGQKVQMGDAIAKVGSTGMSTGPHLHFEVRVLGEPVNPMDYLSVYSRPSAEP
jgi:murein DD-endopeptidase MepM/ murein hydrolase activator NlpD